MARRPGRPRASGDPDGERDTRRDVLDAAAALFCTVGFTSTSTRAIADAAGVRLRDLPMSAPRVLAALTEAEAPNGAAGRQPG